MVAPLSSWPWDNLGSYKYVLYGPLIAQVLYSKTCGDGSSDSSSLCLHLLIISALRGLIHQLWFTFSNMLFLTRRRRIQKEGVDFDQIDKEWDWDNFLILQAFIGAMVFYLFPSLFHGLPLWDARGLIMALVMHVGVSEPLFYWTHRQLFHKGKLFDEYHSIHHSSNVLQSFTAGFATPLEHLFMCGVMAAPILGATLMGFGSLGLVYGYILLFDFMRCMGHSNVEVFPAGLFRALPILRYVVYTPTYHSIHHMEMNSNFCLFMPLFDALGGTLNSKSWELQKEISSGRDEVPDFVFLAHVVDVAFSLHAPFIFRSYSSLPYSFQIVLTPLWPFVFLVALAMWAWSKPFLISFYKIRGLRHQTWVVPRYGFQYFLPFAKDGINDQIEMAILRADKLGIKVLSLAALNKNEALNGGGTLFIDKHPNLKVRVVHGNTLTAAVIINQIPADVKEVFMTGATSKLGRAIALYLCRKKIRVMMLTLSTERFLKIQKEAAPECQQYLVQVTKYQAAQNCKNWIVGKWLMPREQRWAPPGTHFHQFVVPPIFSFRRDCTYGKLAAMRLPKDAQGLGACEYTLDRGAVHACHAGGAVHSLEGWTHHEVGAIDVDRIDVVWNAAKKHGLTPV